MSERNLKLKLKRSDWRLKKARIFARFGERRRSNKNDAFETRRAFKLV